jgi:hypothetical protein
MRPARNVSAAIAGALLARSLRGPVAYAYHSETAGACESSPARMGRIPCCEKDSVKRGQWTPEEDNKLLSYITQYGTRNWRLIPKNAGTS